eukprot:gene3733-6263_t
MAENLVTQVDQNGRMTPLVQTYTEERLPRRRHFWSFLWSLCRAKQRELEEPPQPLHHWQVPQHNDPGYSLLPNPSAENKDRKCLVLDLDETLVHSSFKPVENADFVFPIEIDGIEHHVYVLKRPHVDEFLNAVGQLYEVVLFTASLSKYADPVADRLDPKRNISHRLFREHCVMSQGIFIKDLSRLGRDVDQTIIVDNAPASYLYHPKNAVPIQTWLDDPQDTVLRDLIPFFHDLAQSDDIYPCLRKIVQ